MGRIDIEDRCIYFPDMPNVGKKSPLVRFRPAKVGMSINTSRLEWPTNFFRGTDSPRARCVVPQSDEERYPAATGTRDGTRGPPGNSSAMGGSSVNGVVSRKSVYDRHAAQIAPASRSGSRHDSKVNSRAASFYGPDGAESLMSEEGLFYASRRPVAEKGDAIDAARGRGGAPDEEVYDERADTLDDVYSDSNVGERRVLFLQSSILFLFVGGFVNNKGFPFWCVLDPFLQCIYLFLFRLY